MFTVRKLAAAVGAATAVLAQAPPAPAQAWLGQFTANSINANQQFERECSQLQHPLKPGDREILLGRMQPVVAQYFALTSSGNRRELAKLFRDKEALWQGPGLEGDPRLIVDPYVPLGGAEAPSLEVVGFEFGHDYQSARSIWKVTLPDPAHPGATRDIRYAIDLVAHGAITVKWFIYRITVYPGPEEPSPLTPFCHLRNAYGPQPAQRSSAKGDAPEGAGDAKARPRP